MTLEESKDFFRWIGKYVLGVIVVSWVLSISPFGRDDTDPEWPDRSDMELKTDAKTGCQYLVSSGGGITPRLYGNGKQVGCEDAR